MRHKLIKFITTICLILFVLIFAFVCIRNYLYEEITEKITILNERLYVVRHKVLRNSFKRSRDLLKILQLDSFIFKKFDPTLEVFELFSSKLIEIKNSNLSFHNGYIEGKFLIDLKSEMNIIKIYSLDNMKLETVKLNEIENLLIDFSSGLFYAKKEEKIIKIKSEKEYETFKIPLEKSFDISDVDNGLFLLSTLNEINESQKCIYNIVNNKIKHIDLINSEWSIFAIKGLNIIAQKIGTGDFYIIDLLETSNSYSVKKYQKFHLSIGLRDCFYWDKNLNKIYFFSNGEALFKNKFKVVEYDDNSLQQKIIQINLKR